MVCITIICLTSDPPTLDGISRLLSSETGNAGPRGVTAGEKSLARNVFNSLQEWV